MDNILQNGGLVLSGAALSVLVKAGVSMWRARHQRTEIANDPLRVDKQDKYVTRGEFNRAVERNDADHARLERDADAIHANLYDRLRVVEGAVSELNGLLRAIHADLCMIKERLIRR